MSHARVTLEAVCDHPVREGSYDASLAGTETATACRTSVLFSCETGKSGVGDMAGVERREVLRGEALVGESSGGGNSHGCWRVDTIVFEGFFRRAATCCVVVVMSS
jgi:hypothetical protein